MNIKTIAGLVVAVLVLCSNAQGLTEAQTKQGCVEQGRTILCPTQVRRIEAAPMQRVQASEIQRVGAPELPRVGASEVQRGSAPEIQRGSAPELPRISAPELPRIRASELPRVRASEKPAPANTIAEGVFKFAGGDPIYYSNGQGQYCHYDTWDHYVQLTGNRGWRTQPGSLEQYNMKFGSTCTGAVVAERGKANSSNDKPMTQAQLNAMREQMKWNEEMRKLRWNATLPDMVYR